MPMPDAMIVWLNGTFGSGKTTTAAALGGLLPSYRTFDPETVGYVLRHHMDDLWPGDFQHWRSWRRLVVAHADELTAETGQSLIAVQTVMREDYWTEIRAGLLAAGRPVLHVLLDPDPAALRSRIEASDEARPWRLDHLAEYAAARDWMRRAADLVVDTSLVTAEDAGEQIASAIRTLA